MSKFPQAGGAGQNEGHAEAENPSAPKAETRRQDDAGWTGETRQATRTGRIAARITQQDFEADQATSTCRVIACGERGSSMSIDRETNRVPAYVSFRGRITASGFASNATASNAMASNVMSSNVMASRFAASTTTTPDMVLSVGLRDTRVSCESNRDLSPPSHTPGSPPPGRPDTR